MGEVLGRDAILQADDLEYAEVAVPEWGKDAVVRVRSLTASERDNFERSITKDVKVGEAAKMNFADFRAKLCVLGIVDADGNRLFAEPDVVALGGKNVRALQRVFDAIRELSGMSDEDVDELTADFASAPSTDSASGSQASSGEPVGS